MSARPYHRVVAHIVIVFDSTKGYASSAVILLREEFAVLKDLHLSCLALVDVA